MKDSTSFTMEFKIVGSQRDHKFGNMVREARIAKGLTQKQLGDSVGKSTAYICDIEKHKRLCSDHSRKSKLVSNLACKLDLNSEDCFIAARCPEGIEILEDQLSEFERKNGKLEKEVKTWVFVGFGLGMILFMTIHALNWVLQ